MDIDLFGLALIIVGLVFVLRSPAMRTFRTVIVLAILSALILASNGLPTGPAQGLKIATVWVYVVLILRFQRSFSPLDGPDFDFADAFYSITDRVVKTERASGPTFIASEAYRRSMERAVEELELMRPPNSDWDALRGQTIDYLRFCLNTVNGTGSSDLRAWDAAAAQWQAIQEELGRVRRRHSRFWR